jgi:hypothetical protein
MEVNKADGNLTVSCSVAAILGAADVNDARGYYHCSDGPNFACDYYGNHPHCYCAHLY